jgi:hypothetical protein
MWRGEFAEIDAKAEAKRIGGTCVAFALYTEPPQRKPLTDVEIKDCLDAADQMYCERDGDKELFKARTVLAAHGIKEKT